MKSAKISRYLENVSFASINTVNSINGNSFQREIDSSPRQLRSIERNNFVQKCTTIQRFGVAIKAKHKGGKYVIAKIIIDGRPPVMTATGQLTHGGESFHHEGAWCIDENNLVKRYEGSPILNAYYEVCEHIEDEIKNGNLSTEDMNEMRLPKVEENDYLSVIAFLNKYFKKILTLASKRALGHFGSTSGHSKQGGLIANAKRKFDQAIDKGQDGTHNWEEEWVEIKKRAITLCLESYEEDPGIVTKHPNNYIQMDARKKHMNKMRKYLSDSMIAEEELDEIEREVLDKLSS